MGFEELEIPISAIQIGPDIVFSHFIRSEHPVWDPDVDLFMSLPEVEEDLDALMTGQDRVVEIYCRDLDEVEFFQGLSELFLVFFRDRPGVVLESKELPRASFFIVPCEF